jgi:hypothetical protein
MEKKWEQMNSDERQEAMFQRWLSPKTPEGKDVKFQSPEAEKSYKDRITRIKDAVQMKKLPDRVPVFLLPSFYPAVYAGLTPKELMYDYEKCHNAYKKFYVDFDGDGQMGMAAPGPGKLFDILDYKLYAYPGHGVSPEHSYQCIEGEYMTVREYDLLIHDPTNFFYTRFMPRIYGALEPLKNMANPPMDTVEMYGGAAPFIPYGTPPVQAAFKAILEAGNEAMKWVQAAGAFNGEMTSLGFPGLVGGFAKAPFDTIGDTLRGTKGIMTDMYRNPGKLLEAMDVLTPISINNGAGMTQRNGNPFVAMPLHKGADGFLSDEQFQKFYWPSFKNVLLGLIDQGCVPFPFVEGGFNSRLKYLKEIPKGKMLWLFDQTDMVKAKQIIDDKSCIAGNMPLSLLGLASAQEVKDYAKKLIDTVGKGGGFIMSNGAFFDKIKPENGKAMIQFTKEYGVYQ